MTIVLGIRHGEVHNPEGVIYAGLDGYGLSELGREQARLAAEPLRGLDVEALYCSPLDRAVQTAQAIAEACGTEIRTDDRLYEWRYWTRWAGKTWEDLRDTDAEAFEAYITDPGSLVGAESFTQLRTRVTGWLREAQERHPDGIVVAVTHLEPLRAALVDLLDIPTSATSSIRIGTGQAVRLAPDPHPEPAPLDELVALGRG
ncbi:MAG TPA: histidine phosphatase family protein [Actinomycetota bacterium]|nr:histidine phosphatase family protein [Actinomycetota bacterium]